MQKPTKTEKAQVVVAALFNLCEFPAVTSVNVKRKARLSGAILDELVELAMACFPTRNFPPLDYCVVHLVGESSDIPWCQRGIDPSGVSQCSYTSIAAACDAVDKIRIAGGNARIVLGACPV